MKKIFMILMLTKATFSYQFSFAQNLVPNWSFEDTLSCPAGIDNIDKATGWSSVRNSPDYFNSCNISTIGTTYAGVPDNFFGYQNARTGNAYSGFYAEISNNGRECIGIKLNDTLSIGQKYFVTFFVSRAFVANLNINRAVNKIGCCFSTVSYSRIHPIVIDNYSQVFTDSIISDTLNWSQISGSFIADSAYQYISIGNFFNDSLTTSVNYDSTAIGAYYFVDDIFVSKDSLIGIQEYPENISIDIFPNPTNGNLYILNLYEKPTQIYIYSLLGNQILIDELIKGENLIDVSFLASDVYLIFIIQNGSIKQKKIIKY